MFKNQKKKKERERESARRTIVPKSNNTRESEGVESNVYINGLLLPALYPEPCAPCYQLTKPTITFVTGNKNKLKEVFAPPLAFFVIYVAAFFQLFH